ncbi:MAG: lipid-A-disaccharide synthase [Nitrospirae bacterium]|nr:lipid-A-disaccharide synthase [Nitrospirota bacterium]
MSKKVMISAGEASGELYGALLSREIKRLWPDVKIIGIGGKRMKSEGVHLIASVSGAFGFTETIRHWGHIKNAFKKAKETLIRAKPDILVLIDFPDFNMALAKKAKAAGIPILYYVSPQVWAWRSGRARKIASLVNKIAVLFPFEVDIYRNTGLECEFVGHPIAETINFTQTKEELKEMLGLDPSKKAITILPGSRATEIRRHQLLVKEVAEKIHESFPEIQIIVPLVSGTHLDINLPDYVRIMYDRTSEAVASAEASAVASGTATLETALLGTPMVVFYRVSPISVFIVRMLIKIRFISLVNILSGKEVVRELIQKDATSEKIFSELKRIITDDVYRQEMTSNLQKIKNIMGGKTASGRVASIVGQLTGWNSISA